jgi:hypothetical protein
MHGMPVIRLSGPGLRFKVAVLSHRRTHMKTTLRFEFIDNTLFLLLLFVPVNVLLAGALALAAATAH